MTDGELVAAARTGDEPAFDALYARHHRFVVHSVRRRVTATRDVEVEDIAQDAWFRAWRALPRFDGRSAFRTWVVRIALNAATDAARRGLRKRSPQFTECSEGALREVAQPGAEAAVGAAITTADVRRCLRVLTERERRLVVLIALDGLPLSEVAARLGVALGTVKSCYFRARGKLRAAPLKVAA